MPKKRPIRRLVVVDIDLTICDSSSLDGFLPSSWKKPGDFGEWCRAITNNQYWLPPCKGAKEGLAKLIANPDNIVVFVTSRNNTIYKETKDWIGTHFWTARECEIITRVLGDMRAPIKLKGSVIARLKRRYKPDQTIVIDDDPGMTVLTEYPYKNIRFLQVKNKDWSSVAGRLPLNIR